MKAFAEWLALALIVATIVTMIASRVEITALRAQLEDCRK